MQKSLSELAIPDAFGSTVLALETLLGIVNVMIDEVTKSRGGMHQECASA